MKLLSWNVAGYAGPTKDRQLVEVLRATPDLIALQEVVRGSLEFWREGLAEQGYRVLASDPKLLEVEGPFLPHKGYRMGRRKTMNLIAVKGGLEPLPALVVGVSEGFPEKYLAGRAQINGATVDLHNVHTPPGSTTKMLKVDYWESVMTRVDDATGAARILCGDLNSPWSEDDKGFVTGGGRRDPEEETRWKAAELSFLEHPELSDVYRAHHVAGEPYATSHLRGSTSCRYDHVYVSTEFDLDRCSCEYFEGLLKTGLSDHAPVLARLELR